MSELRLGKVWEVKINGQERSGSITGLEIRGTPENPRHVEVSLSCGVSFTVPWDEYESIPTELPNDMSDPEGVRLE